MVLVQLTHNAFLWCRGNDVPYVQILGGQFTVQTQKITETPFNCEVSLLKQRHGGLGATHREKDLKAFKII